MHFISARLVEVTRCVAARGHRDGDGREQHAHQARERQEPARRDRTEARICGLASAMRLEPLARLLAGVSQAAECRDLRPVAREERGAADAAAGLDQLGRGHVGQVDEQRRRQVGEAHALVRPIVEHAA